MEFLLEFGVVSIFQSVDGVDAVRKLSEVVPDILILDLMMPGMDGFEVLTAVRRREPGQRPGRTVVMSAKMTPAMADQLRLLGADECLSKPFTGEQLRAALRV